jgi:hypothetical protein
LNTQFLSNQREKRDLKYNTIACHNLFIRHHHLSQEDYNSKARMDYERIYKYDDDTDSVPFDCINIFMKCRSLSYQENFKSRLKRDEEENEKVQ